MREGYKSIEDILKEVSEDSGIPLSQVKDIWEHQKAYTEKKMEQKDVYAIFFPFIGTLSFNSKKFAKAIKGKPRKVYQKFIDKIEKLKEHYKYNESIYSNAHKKLTSVDRLAKHVVKEFNTEHAPEKAAFLTNEESWSVIEKHSNEAYEKRKKE